MPWLDKDTYQLPRPIGRALFWAVIGPIVLALWLSLLLLGPIGPLALAIAVYQALTS